MISYEVVSSKFPLHDTIIIYHMATVAATVITVERETYFEALLELGHSKCA